MTPDQAVAASIRRSWAGAPDREALTALGQRLGDRFPGTRAVLFYGSARRQGPAPDRLCDVYVLVERLDQALPSRLDAVMARLLPPNVYAHRDGNGHLEAKVAVMTLDQFEARCTPATVDCSLWARFAQPCRPLYLADDRAAARCARACAQATITLLRETRALVEAGSTEAVWTTALGLTYAAEFRAEGRDRVAALYAADQDYFAALTAPALAASAAVPRPVARLRWSVRRCWVPVLQVARLVKAARTFDGGLDYLARKLNQHSGQAVDITPAMRRRPLRAGAVLFIRLRRRGVFR